MFAFTKKVPSSNLGWVGGGEKGNLMGLSRLLLPVTLVICYGNGNKRNSDRTVGDTCFGLLDTMHLGNNI